MKQYFLLLGAGIPGIGGPQVAKAQASLQLGPQLGYNLSTVSYQASAPGGTSSTAFRSGLSAGLETNLAFGHFCLQPAILYSQLGFRLTQVAAQSAAVYTYTSSSNNRLDYLTLPVKLLLATKPGGEGFQVFAGPYLSMLLGGHYSISDQFTYPNGQVLTAAGEGPVKAGDSFGSSPGDTFYSRRFDTGLQAGLGYRYQGLQLQADYSLGLRNVGATYAASTSSPTYKNRAFQVALTYLFGFTK